MPRTTPSIAMLASCGLFLQTHKVPQKEGEEEKNKEEEEEKDKEEEEKEEDQEEKRGVF